MPRKHSLYDVIEGLEILARYNGDKSALSCHGKDVHIDVDRIVVTKGDIDRLQQLGFNACVDGMDTKTFKRFFCIRLNK